MPALLEPGGVECQAQAHFGAGGQDAEGLRHGDVHFGLREPDGKAVLNVIVVEYAHQAVSAVGVLNAYSAESRSPDMLRYCTTISPEVSSRMISKVCDALVSPNSCTPFHSTTNFLEGAEPTT